MATRIPAHRVETARTLMAQLRARLRSARPTGDGYTTIRIHHTSDQAIDDIIDILDHHITSEPRLYIEVGA